MKKPESKKQKLCLSCQKCCKSVGVYTHPDFFECSTKEVVDFYRMRGFRVKKERGALFLTLDYPCPHLTPDGCGIYEKRPEICRNYDGMEDFGKGCLWSGLKKKG
ncbi:MAG: YkgJ family cysteine cluster protein [Nitrospirae bacterium]|nr:YkgJ family cysteine cluster protein [Nitrospirota bacterium]